MLYQRNLLLYDRQTESLWSQLLGKAATGPLAGTTLRLLSAVQTSWAAWKKMHPKTLALSFQTGHQRDYSLDPYANFGLNRRQALVAEVDGNVKIYPFSELKKAGSSFSDEIAGQRLTIEFDSQHQTAYVRGLNGLSIPSFIVFFAEAKAFYPHAPVFKAR